MIINTETRDVLDNNGQPAKQLVVSYVNNEGTISFLTYIIPASQMYQWKYSKRGEVVDPTYKSWDFKNVHKEGVENYLSEQRLHEILLDLVKANPEVGTLFDLNIPNTSFCDIEVDVDDEGFPDAEHAKNPINTISWVNENKVYVLGRALLSGEDIAWIREQIKEHCKDFKTDYEFTYVYHNNELDLLNDFFYNYVRLAPCITGWNFFGYDYPYLYNRAEHLGIDISYLAPAGTWYKYRPQNNTDGTSIILPKHRMMYDYLEIYVKWDRAVNPKESNKLDWVAEHTVNAKKVEHQLGFKDLWEQQPAKYVFYNAVDSILVREIDNKIKTSSAFFGLANLMHVDALTAFSPVRSLEIVQAEYLYKDGKVMPQQNKKRTSNDEGYEGAFVYQPIPGIYRNVIALDFASLYPTTMRQFNISPDTFVKKDINHKPEKDEIKCVSGAVYKRDYEGFIPKILTDFYNQRKKYKKEMMIAIDEKYELINIYEERFGPFEE